uniref:TLC domain-containing protein n=1 Tax=Cyclophora tenuis TaxID=216820 RepID=A0A7S1D3W2_CYCTE
MNSKAALCELSNPFMHLSRNTRKPLHFILFATVFFLCRILWIPILVRQLYDQNIQLHDPIQIVLLSFYGLNLFWFHKIVRILITGGKSEKKEQ